MTTTYDFTAARSALIELRAERAQDALDAAFMSGAFVQAHYDAACLAIAVAVNAAYDWLAQAHAVRVRS